MAIGNVIITGCRKSAGLLFERLNGKIERRSVQDRTIEMGVRAVLGRLNNFEKYFRRLSRNNFEC